MAQHTYESAINAINAAIDNACVARGNMFLVLPLNPIVGSRIAVELDRADYSYDFAEHDTKPDLEFLTVRIEVL